MPKEFLQEAYPSAQSSSSMNFLDRQHSNSSVKSQDWAGEIYLCIHGFFNFLTQWFERQNFILDSE
jgi:hypothetical protein